LINDVKLTPLNYCAPFIIVNRKFRNELYLYENTAKID
jgi:hypothetical protein